MDFSAILSQAQKNEHGKQTTACYQTKFTPPKRPTKQTKALSENIKKFLARKEQEDQRKALEERKKRENLLALRDHKAQSRINKHLKVCKAANKSVLADAVDNENTAVTIAGPSQPDEDDYGYVSQEASALYNKIVNKYNNAPPQKPLFSSSGKKTIKDIASTKMFAHQPHVIVSSVLLLAILSAELECTRTDVFQYREKRQDINEVRRYCGSCLSSTLQAICDGVYNSRFKKSNRETEMQEGNTFSYELHPFRTLENVWKMLRFRRDSRGIYEECCLKPCSRDEMRSYCGFI